MTRRAWVLFAAMSFLWGIPYLLIKVSLTDVSPVRVVWFRTLFAALVLVPIAWRAGGFEALRGAWARVLVITLLEVTVPFTLISAGEQHIASSMAGLLIASDPLLIAALALLVDPAEKVSGSRLAGMVLGLVGVALAVGINLSGDGLRLLGAAMVLAATACYAAAALLLGRWFRGGSQTGIAAATVTLNTVLMAPIALLAGSGFPTHPQVIASLLTLGLACTALAFLVYFTLISEAGAARAGLVTYVNPAVALVLGALILHEALTPAMLAGFALIVAGSYVAARSPRRRVAAVSPREAPEAGTAGSSR